MANRSGASNAAAFRATKTATKQPAAQNPYAATPRKVANYGADNPYRLGSHPMPARTKPPMAKGPTAKSPIEMRKPLPTSAPKPKKTGYAAKKTGKMYL